MNCQVMGIVNVTPDSFSDGGQYFKPEEAVRRVRNLIDEGADIIDLGGESTRPGATPLDWTEEWARLEPVLRELKGTDIPLSVDTYHPETAEKALGAGATIINCVYAEPAREMLRFLQREGVRLVVPASIAAECPQEGARVSPRIWLDPMIGFGTTREEDVDLLHGISQLAARGKVLVGSSRKRIVKKLTGEKQKGKDLGGSLGLAIYAALQGASAVRVHDVRETAQALRVLAALG